MLDAGGPNKFDFERKYVKVSTLWPSNTHWNSQKFSNKISLDNLFIYLSFSSYRKFPLRKTWHSPSQQHDSVREYGCSIGLTWKKNNSYNNSYRALNGWELGKFQFNRTRGKQWIVAH